MAGHNSGKDYRDFVICGFGYVSATEDYKFVVVTSPRDVTCFHVYMFSMRANCWEVIKAPQFSSTDYNNHEDEVGTLSNEAIHWVNYRGGDSDPAIHAFDLAEEKFREMPLPVSIQNVDTSMRVTRTQLLLQGCLCVWTTWLQTADHEIWAMTQSWVKLFGFSEHDLPNVFRSLNRNWDLCFVTEGGTVVIKLYDRNVLVMIECCKQETPVYIGQYRVTVLNPRERRISFNAIVYYETLVSVPE